MAPSARDKPAAEQQTPSNDSSFDQPSAVSRDAGQPPSTLLDSSASNSSTNPSMHTPETRSATNILPEEMDDLMCPSTTMTFMPSESNPSEPPSSASPSTSRSDGSPSSTQNHASSSTVSAPSQTPIITYPEFLQRAREQNHPPRSPLVTLRRLQILAYTIALLAGTGLVVQQLILQPWQEALLAARRELVATAAGHVQRLIVRLSAMVSVIPATASRSPAEPLAEASSSKERHKTRDTIEGQDESESSGTEFFSRDAAVQTMDPDAVESWTRSDANELLQQQHSIVTRQTQQIRDLTASFAASTRCRTANLQPHNGAQSPSISISSRSSSQSNPPNPITSVSVPSSALTDAARNVQALHGFCESLMQRSSHIPDISSSNANDTNTTKPLYQAGSWTWPNNADSPLGSESNLVHPTKDSSTSIQHATEAVRPSQASATSEDAVTAVTLEIKRIKGVLLSARSFPRVVT